MLIERFVTEVFFDIEFICIASIDSQLALLPSYTILYVQAAEKPYINQATYPL